MTIRLRSRSLFTGLLVLFSASVPFGVWAQDDDDDDDDTVQEEDPDDPVTGDEEVDLEQCLRLLGRDSEDGWVIVAAHKDEQNAQNLPQALQILARSQEHELIVGAALYLGQPLVRRTAARGEDRAAPIREKLDKSLLKLLEPDRITNDPKERQKADRLKKRRTKLVASLAEALGAIGNQGDLLRLERMITDDDPAFATAAARGLCRARRTGPIERLLAITRDLLVKMQEEKEEDAELDPEDLEEKQAAGPSNTARRLESVTSVVHWLARSRESHLLVEAAVYSGSNEDLPQSTLDALTRITSLKGTTALRSLGRELIEEDNAPKQRAFGFTLLAVTRDRESSEDILDALTDPVPEVRAAAADAVFRLRIDKAIPDLMQLLTDPVPEVCRASHNALKRLSGREYPLRLGLWKRWYAEWNASRPGVEDDEDDEDDEDE